MPLRRYLSNLCPRGGSVRDGRRRGGTALLLLAVEPMLAVGTGQIAATKGRWPIFSADGSRSVHYEADVLIAEDGPIDLTEGLASLPEIVGRPT